MDWCENNGVEYVFGLTGTRPLSRKVDDKADAVRTQRALDDRDAVRGYAETRHQAGSWKRERRAVARIEATRLGLDIRFVVTNIQHGSPERIYDDFYCARGQAENLIKAPQNPTGLRSHVVPFADSQQVRLVLHTAAYWLMLSVRDAIPESRDLARAEFSTLRLRLIKIAARVIETASCVRMAFSAYYPEAALFALEPLGP